MLTASEPEEAFHVRRVERDRGLCRAQRRLERACADGDAVRHSAHAAVAHGIRPPPAHACGTGGADAARRRAYRA
jgi:hypothetical protein